MRWYCQPSTRMETERMMRRTTVTATFGVLLALASSSPARADEAANHYTLALQYKRVGRTAEAITECERAIALRADYAAAHLTLGNLYRAQNDYARAVTSFEKAVKLQPKDSTAHANL